MTIDNDWLLEQITEAELEQLTAAEIVAARKAGKLNELLGAEIPLDAEKIRAAAAGLDIPADPEPDTSQISREALELMQPADIVAARKAGRLDSILGYDQLPDKK